MGRGVLTDVSTEEVEKPEPVSTMGRILTVKTVPWLLGIKHRTAVGPSDAPHHPCQEVKACC